MSVMRKGYLGVFFALVTISGSARALFGAPLKLLTCEVLLGTSSREATEKNQLVYSLQQLKFRMGMQKLSSSKRIRHKRLRYAGDFKGMPLGKRLTSVQDINGLIDNIQNDSSSFGIVGIEVRGADNIAKSLAEMDKNEAELTARYNVLINRMFPARPRGMITITYPAMLVAASAVALFNYDHSFTDKIFLGYLALVDIVQSGATYIYHTERLDWTYSDLKKVLETVVSDSTRDQILISSDFMRLPEQVHRSLVAQDEVTDQTRREGLAKVGDPSASIELVRWINRHFSDRAQTSFFSKEKGDKIVYLDNIVYWDQITSEPVWLFFYRAFDRWQ